MGGWVLEPTRGVRGSGIGRGPLDARDGGEGRRGIDGDKAGRRGGGVEPK